MAHLALFASGVPNRLAADKPCFCLFLPLTVGPHSSVLSLPMPGTMELTATVNEEQGEDYNQGAYTQYLPWYGHELPVTLLGNRFKVDLGKQHHFWRLHTTPLGVVIVLCLTRTCQHTCVPAICWRRVPV